MSDSPLKSRLQSDMKSSMKSGEKGRLLVIRLMLAAIKQIEVDERIELDDARVTSVLDKMCKQRRESIEQFSGAGRDDLVAIESTELEIIGEYLPEALSDAEITKLVGQAINDTGAESIRQMGSVMNILKPRLQGRADMGKVSQLVKSKLV
ncbi:MAG: GatB/YqeY domain-containing protein [Gammaproteobacteria bacterium]